MTLIVERPKLFGACLASIMAILLNGCMATTITSSVNQPLVERYYAIVAVPMAYLDDDNNLYICMHTRLQKGDDLHVYTLRISYNELDVRNFNNVMYHLYGNVYLFLTSKASTGCRHPKSATMLTVHSVDVDDEIDTEAELEDYEGTLPVDGSGYAIYFMHSRKLESSFDNCSQWFQSTHCSLIERNMWPRLMIRASSKKGTDSINIVSGHNGNKKGHDVVSRTAAGLVDIVTFPLQLIFIILVALFGHM